MWCFVEHTLWMPLQAVEKAGGIGGADGLDDAIGGVRDDFETSAWLVDGLVVGGIGCYSLAPKY